MKEKKQVNWHELSRAAIGGALWIGLVMVMLYRFPYDNLAIERGLGGVFVHVYQYSGVPNADLLHITSAVFGAAVVVAGWLSNQSAGLLIAGAGKVWPKVVNPGEWQYEEYEEEVESEA